MYCTAVSSVAMMTGEWLWIIQKAAQHYTSGDSGAQREDGGYVLAQLDSLRADGEKT